MKSTCVIIVTFNPVVSVLEGCIKSLYDQSDVLIIDNTEENSKKPNLLLSKNLEIEIFEREINIGIGAAQNIGIKIAMQRGYKYILLSDQDTIFPSSYVVMLISLLSSDASNAAACPTFLDRNEAVDLKCPVVLATERGSFKTAAPTGNFDLFEAPASGMLISVAAIREIGLMNEDLFIDWVDFEWCWRARSKGYKLKGSSFVTVSHTFGDSAFNFMNKKFNARHPIRHYYITRNCIFLTFYGKNINTKERLRLLIKAILFILAYPLLFTPRLLNLRMVFRAVVDGTMAKLGKLTF